MPRGVPKAGVRNTAARREREALGLPEPRSYYKRKFPVEIVPQIYNDPLPTNRSLTIPVIPLRPVEPITKPMEDALAKLSDFEISEQISRKFGTLSRLIDTVLSGAIRSLVISGPPGLGKTFMVKGKLHDYDPEGERTLVVKGKIRATGLYRRLYDFRNDGDVLVLDDADEVFFDPVALNVLKAACDSDAVRMLSWESEAKLEDENGDLIPRSFEYRGTIIFITNHDLVEESKKRSKIAPHLSAMASRSVYFAVGLHTTRQKLIRIRQVVDASMPDLTRAEVTQVMVFIEANINTLWELSIRTALKVGTLLKSFPDSWEEDAKATVCVAR